MSDPTDFRALCAELTDELDEWLEGYLINDPPDEFVVAAQEKIDRARAALAAEPQQGASVTPDDFRQWWKETGSASPAPSPEMLLTANAWANYCLARYGAHPAPVPVAERLPGERDCDAQGRCWFFDPCDKGWWCYRGGLPSDGDPAPFTHWLPHWALPLPQEAQS